MEKMTLEQLQRVGEAIVVWSGWGRSAHPLRDEELLVAQFGKDLAAELLPLIRELENDFYLSDARHTAANLAEMASVSAAQFTKKHPGLPANAVRALAWCYTFDYK